MSLWLVVDTATPAAVVGLVDVDAGNGAGAVVVERVLEVAQRHAEALPGVVADVVGGHAIAGVGVGTGPGSFIGVRTGIAFAKGLARAKDVPLVGVPTLWSLVAGVDPGVVGDGDVKGVVDAKRGEVYVGEFVVAGGVVSPVGDARAVAPGDVGGGRVVGAFKGAVVERAGPSALGMLRVLLALPRVDERASLAPLYVRAPDAKLPAVDPQRARAAALGLKEGT